MKVVRLMTFSGSYLAYASANGVGQGETSWLELWRGLAHDSFSFSDSWEDALRAEGVDAIDLPHGVPFIDRVYAAEMGIDGEAMTSTLHRLKIYAPDVLFLSSLEAWTTSQVDAIRVAVPTIRAVVGMAGVSIAHLPVLKRVDVLLTCMKGLAADLKADGLDARVVSHAFDPRILDRLDLIDDNRTGFAFFGNVVSGPQYHDERLAFLERLAEQVGLVPYSDEMMSAGLLGGRFAQQSAAYYLGKLTAYLPSGAADMIPNIALWRQAAKWPRPPRVPREGALKRHRRPAVYGLDMYRALARTALTFNMHIGGAGPYAANMRLYEATGVGACLLTDAKSDLAEYFEPDVEVIAYRSKEEAEEKARYLLDHPAEMRAIGAAGQRRTLTCHTYRSRAPIVASALKAALE